MSGMEVTLGLHLDGQRATRPENKPGTVTFGPLGLLDFLETQLGLLAERPSHAERIARFRHCLVQVNNPTRFYHRSFDTDDLGTAAMLLDWRDTWHLHGWNGSFPKDAATRLQDMAAVEAIAINALPPSVGERLAKVLVELARRRPTIDVIYLMDPIASFPMRWRQVLQQLPFKEIDEPARFSKGFLGQLQQGLRNANAGNPASPISWEQDGSVVVVQAETIANSANWLARQLGNPDETLIVAGADAPRLDSHLVGAGMAREGFQDISAFRPAQQVLPLAMELLWEPVNFYGLVQFLTHPMCPLPGFARRKLAEKLADRPGIGGEVWDDTLALIDQHYGEKAPQVREQIQQWITCDRYAPEHGVPVATVIERANTLAGYFRAGLGSDSAAHRMAFQGGYAQCTACVNALGVMRDQGVQSLSPRQLQQLLAQVTARGTGNALWVAEVGAHMAVTHPAAIIGSVPHVAWWKLTMPSLPAAWPWSLGEIREIAAAGVELPDMETCMAQAAADWLRPVFAATQKLTLVLPAKGEEVHPLWQMIAAVTKDPVVLDLDALLGQGGPALSPLPCKPLPAEKRWWKFGKELQIPLREIESFSSLELFLFNPCDWLLKYPAKLRPSSIASVGVDARLLGSLAHRLAERWFSQPKALSMKDDAFESWFPREFDRLLSEEGAILQMPGRGTELANFRHQLLQAMRELRDQLSKAMVNSITPEAHLYGTFVGGKIEGSADLVAGTKDGALAIIDMKWGGESRYREKLQKQRHLQLAIYAELLRQSQGVSPEVAYFILSRHRLLAPNRSLFPGAVAVSGGQQGTESSHSLWRAFEQTWAWRKELMDAGLFEAARESLEETDGSKPPPDALAMEYLNEDYSDFRFLTGWEA